MNEQLPTQYIVRARRASYNWWRGLTRQQRRWILIGGGAGLALFLVIALRGGSASQHNGKFRQNGPSTVAVATIAKGNLNITLNALGTVTPLATVTVKPQVSGQITDIAFTEGQMVQKGDLLAIIDPRPFQA